MLQDIAIFSKLILKGIARKNRPTKRGNEAFIRIRTDGPLFHTGETMNITLHIPDSIARSLRIPEDEAEQRLRQELAIALYAQGLLSFGKASELAGTSRFLFADVLTQRKIARHYAQEELTEDFTYADGE
jgi:predicted HTH domain antitoxin